MVPAFMEPSQVGKRDLAGQGGKCCDEGVQGLREPRKKAWHAGLSGTPLGWAGLTWALKDVRHLPARGERGTAQRGGCICEDTDVCESALSTGGLPILDGMGDR